MRVLAWATSALVLLLYGCQAFAGQDATHARLIEGPDSIEALLRLPDGLAAGRYVVQCEAWVRPEGRAHRFVCYTGEKQVALVEAVRVAGRRARFVPAMRAGRKVDVYMLVMVQIDTTQSEPLILAVPNNGVEAERYGLLYSAPQRFNEFTWNAEKWENWNRRSGRILLWQNLHIDEDGKVLDCVVTNASGVPAFFVKRIEEQVKRMEFMPGTFEGRPVAMFLH